MTAVLSRLRSLGRWLLDRRRYPRRETISVEGVSATFEATTATEAHRVFGFGGERNQLAAFLERIDGDDHVWDVGANVGLYAVLAASKGATVDAFEPAPSFAERLRRNRRLNGLEGSIGLHEFGLSDEDRTTTLFTGGIGGASPNLVAGLTEGEEGVAVELVAPGSLDLRPPRAVKIDVEGHEARVIEGLDGLLDDVHTVLVEVHPTMQPAHGREGQTTDLLRGRGFRLDRRFDRNEQTHLLFTAG